MVQYSHDGQHYAVTTASQLASEHFDKSKGLVKDHADALILDGLTRSILTRLERAKHNVEAHHHEPTKARVKAEYERLVKSEVRQRKLVVLGEVAREGHFENELEKWPKETVRLNPELELAESKLLEAQRALGVNNQEKLTYWIEEFVKAKTLEHAASTMRGYGTVSKLVEE